MPKSHDHLTETKITFALATKALEQGADTKFFRQLADAYDELSSENDYDLDIAIYAEEAEG